MLKRKAVSVLTVIAVVASLNRYAKAEDDNPNYSAENDAQHRQSFSQMISKTDHFVGIATSDKDRQNICIHLKIENSTVNQETQTLELIVNISRIYQDSSSNEEELRIEVTEGKNLHMNITRGSHVIEVRGELVPSENQTCFIVVPKYNGDQSGPYFVFADARLPSSEVDECRKELCKRIGNYGAKCFQTDCRKQQNKDTSAEE